jgi:hypothetical protein
MWQRALGNVRCPSFYVKLLLLRELEKRGEIKNKQTAADSADQRAHAQGLTSDIGEGKIDPSKIPRTGGDTIFQRSGIVSYEPTNSGKA